MLLGPPDLSGTVARFSFPTIHRDYLPSTTSIEG